MKELDNAILAFMRERLDRMGLVPSGIYGYYEARLQRGIGLSDYEWALLDHLAAAPPKRVVHAGIGIGTLAVALASRSIPVLGYERDKTRIAAAVALQEAVGATYEIRKSYFPDDGVEPGGALVFTNVPSSWTTEREDAIIATFSGFDRVILDLRGFGRVRDSEDQRFELLGRIGGTHVALPVPNHHYVEIRPAPAGVGQA